MPALATSVLVMCRNGISTRTAPYSANKPAQAIEKFGRTVYLFSVIAVDECSVDTGAAATLIESGTSRKNQKVAVRQVQIIGFHRFTPQIWCNNHAGVTSTVNIG